jgi:hypothetical protein
MSTEPRITWTVDSDEATHEDAREILDQIENQLQEKTNSDVDSYGVEQLGEVTAAEILIQFVISTSSILTAEAIVDTLKNRQETERVDVDVDIDTDGDADIDIEINK